MSVQPPSIATLSQRLTSLSSLILERSRVISLGLPASASTDTQILRGLTVVRDGMARLEDEIEIERSGLSVGAGGGGRVKGPGISLGRSRISFSGQGKEVDLAALKGLGQRYDRVIEMMEADDVGSSKVQGLKRQIRSPSPPSPGPAQLPSDPLASTPPQFTIESPASSPPFSPPFAPTPDRFRDDASAGPSSPRRSADEDDIHDPLHSRASGRVDRSVHQDYSAQIDEADDDREERSENQLLQTQRDLMSDQDQRLSLLSNSISRQNHLSIQIGSELDLHSDLLDDTELAMDRTHDRLNKAKGRLDKVAKGAKAYGSTITIVVLILILLILIIAFKT